MYRVDGSAYKWGPPVRKTPPPVLLVSVPAHPTANLSHLPNNAARWTLLSANTLEQRRTSIRRPLCLLTSSLALTSQRDG